MSKTSAAKKSRRKKRLSTRNESWLPDEVHAEIKGVARIANEIVPRGWEFDRDFSTEELVTWYYPPSGIQDDSHDPDEAMEPVTRIWVTDPAAPHVILVGSTEDTPGVALTVEELFAQLDDIEAHRPGD